MIRRDNTQDADKGRYYSNFWIEVAMGKEGGQSAAATLSDDDVAVAEPAEMTDADNLLDLTDFPAPAAVQPAKPAKSKTSEKKPEAPRSLSSLADLASIDMMMKNSADLGDETEVDLATDEPEDLDVPLTGDYDFEEGAGEDEIAAESDENVENAEDEYDDFEDDEEEGDGWGGGRKKPSKPQKQRRERRQY
jgi:hypothetical protein